MARKNAPYNSPYNRKKMMPKTRPSTDWLRPTLLIFLAVLMPRMPDIMAMIPKAGLRQESEFRVSCITKMRGIITPETIPAKSAMVAHIFFCAGEVGSEDIDGIITEAAGRGGK
jgi:hypothetical protein